LSHLSNIFPDSHSLSSLSLLCFLSIAATQGRRTGYGRLRRVSEVNRRRIRLSDGFGNI
ncbi:hypothetical protein LINPERHAP2_LOCUS17692, partial [Linum perenne]